MSEPKRYDVLITCEDLNRGVAPRAGEAILRILATRRMLRPVDEAIADKWAEVYCTAAASAHEPFIKGVYEGATPIFHEAVVRFGEQPIEMPFGGPEGQMLTFYIELRGCLFQETMGKFKTQFKDALHCRPAFHVRDYVTPHAPHREVPEDEEPQDRRKKRGSAGVGQSGTRVEEW